MESAHTHFDFSEIRPTELDGNLFRRIGEQWMLVSAAGTDGRPNTMTASWGTAGILWGKPVAVCFIRPQRFTYGLIEESDRLSLSFLPDAYRDALKLCGSLSGRDGDKFKAAGLTPLTDAQGTPFVGEAEAVLLCRKLYADDIRENQFIDPAMLKHYAAKDFHRFYVCEIESVLVRK